MPKGVNQAIIAIWVTIGLSVIAALINKWIGEVTSGEFIGYMVVYSLFCIFPYKLSKGSNTTRWLYTIVTVMSMLFMINSSIVDDLPKADWVASIIMLPIEIFIIFRLFQSEASLWFLKD